MKRFLFLLFIPVFCSSQNVPLGQWRGHFPFYKAMSVADAGDKVFCASQDGIFYLQKEDASLHTITTINGLSEVPVSAMAYNDDENTLVIGYQSGNIDLLKSGNSTNLPVILNKSLTGGKNINNITPFGKYAFLSCDFGIVMLDLAKGEVQETFYLGYPGRFLKVYDVAFDGVFYYAATDSGLYTAHSTNPFLSDPSNWARENTLPFQKFNSVCFAHNRIFANYISEASAPVLDTVFSGTRGNWSVYPWDPSFSLVGNLDESEGFLVITNSFSASFFDASQNRLHYIAAYHNSSAPAMAVLDPDGNTIWTADKGLGLVKNTQTYFYFFMTPDGPENHAVWSMDIKNGVLAVATGTIEGNLDPSYTRNGFHVFKEGDWKSFTDRNVDAFDTVNDILTVAVDPSDPDHFFAGSWGKGLLEFRGGLLTGLYGNDGVSLVTNGIGSSLTLIGGLVYDSDGNLWITNSGTGNPLVVYRKDGTWGSFNLAGAQGPAHLGQIVIDQTGQKWIVLPRGGGLLVYDEITNKAVKMAADVLPTENVFSVAVDRTGQLWVGTSAGVSVIFSPGGISGGVAFTVDRIYVNQDGHTEYLLEKEVVTAIAVDGANRKWFGTSGGGVFLQSEDGSENILQFSTKNSPLPSDNIRSIAVDGLTGEVFFGTDKGIVSYRGTATEGNLNMDQALVFPNPVRPDYNGMIGIKGLTENADFKITDITGNLVYAGTAFGGQAIWDGKNKAGKRASTGVYLVFCSDAAGKEKVVAKVFFVN